MALKSQSNQKLPHLEQLQHQRVHRRPSSAILGNNASKPANPSLEPVASSINQSAARIVRPSTAALSVVRLPPTSPASSRSKSPSVSRPIMSSSRRITESLIHSVKSRILDDHFLPRDVDFSDIILCRNATASCSFSSGWTWCRVEKCLHLALI